MSNNNTGDVVIGKEGEYDIVETRSCVYSVECLGVACTTKDESYHLVFCSVTCQERYHEHRQRNWERVTAEVVDETDLASEFATLWHLHVALTRQLIMAVTHAHEGGEQLGDDRVEKLSILEALKHNHIALGRLFAITYGQLFGDEVARRLTEHTQLTHLVVFDMVLNAKQRPIDDIDAEKRRNTYYNQWREQAQALIRFIIERMSPGANDDDESPPPPLIKLVNTQLDTTLREMVDEANGSRAASLEDYKAVNEEMEEIEGELAIYMNEPINLAQREKNRQFYALWHQQARDLCLCVQLYAMGHTDDEATAELESQLKENMMAITVEGFTVKYGYQVAFSVQALYDDLLGATKALIGQMIVTRRDSLRDDTTPLTRDEVMGGRGVMGVLYIKWKEIMNGLSQTLENDIISSTAASDDAPILHDYFKSLGRHLIGLALDIVNEAAATTEAAAEKTPHVEEANVCEEIENQCVKIADLLLAYIDA